MLCTHTCIHYWSLVSAYINCACVYICCREGTRIRRIGEWFTLCSKYSIPSSLTEKGWEVSWWTNCLFWNILTSGFSFFSLKYEKKLENEATLAWPFVAYKTPRLVEARLSVCKWFDGWRTQKRQVHNWRSTVSTGESLQITSTTWSI